MSDESNVKFVHGACCVSDGFDMAIVSRLCSNCGVFRLVARVMLRYVVVTRVSILDLDYFKREK